MPENRMDSLRAHLRMAPGMKNGGVPRYYQGGSQGGVPPMMPPPPPAVPSVGGGLPGVADNMRNSMPPARPMPPPQGPPPQGPPPQGAGMTTGITPGEGEQVNDLLAGLDPDARAGVRGTIEQSENPEEMLPNAIASSVAAVADSREGIIAMFAQAQDQALNIFDSMMGAQSGMSETDMGIMDLLSGGGEEMSIADEINMS
jgi:hypothetical protein